MNICSLSFFLCGIKLNIFVFWTVGQISKCWTWRNCDIFGTFHHFINQSINWFIEKIIVRIVNNGNIYLIIMFCCTTFRDKEKIILCNNSRVSYCDWLRSYSVTLWPRWYGVACTDAVCCPASGFSCLPCLWSFSGPTTKTWHWSKDNWRSIQAPCLHSGGGGVYVFVQESGNVMKRQKEDEKLIAGMRSRWRFQSQCQLNLHVHKHTHTYTHWLFSHLNRAWRNTQPSDPTNRIEF